MQMTKASGIASWVWFVAGAGIAGFIGFNVACVPMDAASNGSRVLHKLFCVAATGGGVAFGRGCYMSGSTSSAAAAAAAAAATGGRAGRDASRCCWHRNGQQHLVDHLDDALRWRRQGARGSCGRAPASMHAHVARLVGREQCCCAMSLQRSAHIRPINKFSAAAGCPAHPADRNVWHQQAGSAACALEREGAAAGAAAGHGQRQGLALQAADKGLASVGGCCANGTHA